MNQTLEQSIDILINTYSTTEWTGGKFSGAVFQRSNSKVFNVILKGKVNDKDIYKSISVNPKDYNNDINKTKDEALKIRNYWSDTLNLTTNKYKIINDQNNEPKYVIIKMSKGYITLIDYDELEKIEKYPIYASKSGNENAKSYCGILVDNKDCRLHKYITGYELTDHINRYPLDNRKENLRDSNYSENNKNRTRINKTDITFIQGNYSAKIIINNPKTEIYKIFDNMKDAKKWIKNKIDEIDKDISLDYDYQYNKLFFEKIMEKFGDRNQWHDNKLFIEEKKDDLITVELNSDKKQKIYDSFKNLYPTFDTSIFVLKGMKIEHIKHDSKEFKYCSKCDNWKEIIEYFTNSKNYDTLDNRCKSCCNDNKKGSNKKWKEENKEKVKEYNKMYREKMKAQKEENKKEEINEEIKKEIEEKDELIKETKKNSKRKTIEDYKKIVEDLIKEKDGKIDKIELVDENYTATIICSEGHKFTTRVKNLQKGNYCTECAYKKQSEDTERNEKIAEKMKEYFATEEGKKSKEESHKKRSETMAKQREEIQKNLSSKVCKKCNTDKEISEYSKKSDTKDGYQPYCRECVSAAKRVAKNK